MEVVQENLELKDATQSKQLCAANVKLFQYYQVWPRNDFDKHAHIRTTVVSSIVIIGFYFTLAYSIIYAFINFSKVDTQDFIELVGQLFSVTVMSAAFLKSILHKSQISSLLNHISDVQSFGKPSDLDKVEKFCNRTVWLYAVGCNITYVTYILSGFLSKGVCEKEIEGSGSKKVCGMVYPTWMPFPIYNHWVYYSVFALQSAGIIINGGISMSFYSLLITSVEITFPKIKHFKQLLDEMFQREIRKEKMANLKNCIRYHQHIISLLDEENELFEEIYFAVIGTSTVAISVFLYSMFLVPTIKTFAMLCTWLSILFLICFAGQRVVDKSEAIIDAIYFTNWYEADVEIRKYILLMLMRSQKFMKLQPIGLDHISYNTFKEVISKIYSLSSLLIQEMRKNEES